MDWLGSRFNSSTSGRTGSPRSHPTRVNLSAPASTPAMNPRAISTGASALGLLGRCGNSRASVARTSIGPRNAANAACPACALSFRSVVVIWIVLPPSFSLTAGVTVWGVEACPLRVVFVLIKQQLPSGGTFANCIVTAQDDGTFKSQLSQRSQVVRATRLYAQSENGRGHGALLLDRRADLDDLAGRDIERLRDRAARGREIAIDDRKNVELVFADQHLAAQQVV